MELNLFDFITIFVFGISTLLGTSKGFMVSVLSIISFVTSITMTILLVPAVEEVVSEHVHNDLVVNMLSIFLSYMLSRIACGFIFGWLNDIIKPFTISMVDRILGFAIGTIRGVLLCIVLFVCAAVITSGSYVSAKNLWELTVKFDASYYPNWFKNSYSFNRLDTAHQIMVTFCAGSFVQTKFEKFELKNVNTDIFQNFQNITPNTNHNIRQRKSNTHEDHDAQDAFSEELNSLL